MATDFVYLLWLSLISYSLTFAIIESSAPVFKGIRAIVTQLNSSLVECYHCVGFWISIGVHLLVFKGVAPTSLDSTRIFMVYVLSSAILGMFYDKVVTALWKAGK